MNVTRKAEYAVILTAELARNASKAPLSIKSIALSEKISYDFLRQVAHLLDKNNIIVGEEGKDGGYRLAKPAKKILLKDILAAVDEPFYEKPCCDDSKSKKCGLSAICPEKSVLYRIQKAVEETFGNLSLDILSKGDISCAKIWKKKSGK